MKNSMFEKVVKNSKSQKVLKNFYVRENDGKFLCQKKYVGESDEKLKKMLRYAPELVALSLGNSCEIRELLDSQLMSPHSIGNGKQTELYGLYTGVVGLLALSSQLHHYLITSHRCKINNYMRFKETVLRQRRLKYYFIIHKTVLIVNIALGAMR